MFRRYFFARLIFCFLLPFWVSGCGGSDGDEVYPVVTDSQGNIREVVSTDYVLADNVTVFDSASGIDVTEIDGDSLTLTGRVPALAVGDVIVKGEGVSQFSRRIASITTGADATTMTTERIGLNDIFKEADIQETINMGPEFLESLQPAIPGVTFGKPEQVRAQGTQSQSWRLPITFNEAVVSENGRGSVVLNGEVGLSVALRTDLQIGVKNFIIPTLNRFELTPVVTIDGKLDVKGTGAGDFRKELPLCAPIKYPLVGFANLGLNLEGTLQVVVDGYIQSEGTFAIKEAKIVLEGGIRYQNEQWGLVQNIIPTFQIDPPALKANAKITLSIMQPKVSLNLCDMGEVFLNAQVLRLEAEATAVTNPAPAYDVRVFRTTGIEVGARLAVGISPLAVKYEGYFPIVSGERTQVAQLGVPLPQPDSSDLYTLIVPVGGESQGEASQLKVGEEKLLVPLTFALVNLGPALVPIAVPRSCQWTSSNSNVVKITDYGFFAVRRGVGPGSADITSRTNSGRIGSYTQSVGTSGAPEIKILPGLTLGLQRNRALPGVRAQAILGDGQVQEFSSRQMRAIGTYPDGSTADLTYALNWSTVGDNTRAFRDGQIDGRFMGTSAIRVTDPLSGRTAQTEVEVVRRPVASITLYPLAPSTASLTAGQTLQLRASARYADSSTREVTRFVEWYSPDPSIASVAGGLVTANKPGEVDIFALDAGANIIVWKSVVVNANPVVSIRIRPENPGTLLVGGSQQFKATAQFQDGTSSSATNDVRWSCDNSNVATIDQQGVLRLIGPGSCKVKAQLQGRTATSQTIEVNGPAGFVFVTQPQDGIVNIPFDVTVEVRDAKDQLWTPPVQVTLELASGPSGARLGGGLTRTSAGGRVTFSGLSVNQIGQGYKLQTRSSGLSVAESNAFAALTPAVIPPVVDPGPNPGPNPNPNPNPNPSPTSVVGHLFVSNSVATAGVGSVNLIPVQLNGALGTSIPYDVGGRAAALTKLGNVVVTADPANNRLTSYLYNPTAGTLTQAHQTPIGSLGTTIPTILKLDSGGGEYVVSLNSFDHLVKVFRFESDGSYTEGGTFTVPGSPRDLTYYDAPGTTDYIYVSDGPSRRIYGIALDTTNPVLTLAATAQGFANQPFEDPGAMETLGENLFALNPNAEPAANANDNFNWYKINSATGALTGQSLIFGVGNGPVAIHAVGQYLYIGNQISADISVYRVGPTILTSVDGGNPVPAGQVNPHSFADITLSATKTALYVATSTNIASFDLDVTTGVITTLNSLFGGVGSPADIAH